MPFHTVAIDFGTLMCRIAAQDSGKHMPAIIRNNLSNESTPSVVALQSGEQRAVGEAAAMKDCSRPNCALFKIKGALGRLDNDYVRKTIVASGSPLGDDSLFGFYAGNGEEVRLSIESLAASLLSHVAAFVPPAQEGEPERKLCISVPHVYSAAQREALLVAARTAWPNTDIMLVDDIAAAAAYFHHGQLNSLHETDSCDPIAIVDLGHEHTSVGIVSASKSALNILAVAGSDVACSSIDANLASVVFGHCAEKHKVDVTTHPKSRNRILKECKKAKEMLSTTDKVMVQLEALKDDIDISLPLMKNVVEQASADYIAAVGQVCQQVLAASGVKEVKRVEVIGGGWRVPVVATALKQLFGVAHLGVSLDANLTVSQGAAIYGALVTDPEAKLPEDGSVDAVHKVAVTKPKDCVWQPEFDEEAIAARVDALKKTEAALDQVDSVIRNRLKAFNDLESYVLRTRSHIDPAGLAGSDIGKVLDAAEGWLWEDGESADQAGLEVKLAELTEQISTQFPQLGEYLQKLADEERRKEAELVELAKSNAGEKELKSDPQRLRAAQERKDQGVKLFKEEHFEEAQTRFVQALQALAQIYDTKNEETAKKKNEISLSCHLNIATCSLKNAKYTIVVNNCNSALDIAPNHAKAYYRRGQAHVCLNDYKKARADLEKAKELAGSDPAIEAELKNLTAKEEAEKAKEKKMFGKMFS